MLSQNIIRYGALLILLNGCAAISPPQTPSRETTAMAGAKDPATPLIAEPREAEKFEPKVPPHSDVWQRLSSTFPWAYPTDQAVGAALERLVEHPRGFERATERAAPYLWYIAGRLEQRNLPSELALVPLIESGYRAQVQSPRGAVGLWQFMPATGRRFGLKQTRWYDARGDVIHATNAALDYLSRLNQRFNGDWLLAIAAYNCGPTKVRQALKKNNATSYWSIAADLPPETRRHIPRLLASIQIIREPARYQITIESIPNRPAFTQIDLDGPIALAHLFSVPGWSQSAFKELNPAFKRDYTDPNGPFEILVPIGLERAVQDTLARIPKSQRVPTQIHVVQSGDTLSGISQRYSVAIYDLKAQNRLRGNRIKIGKELVVPVPSRAYEANDPQGLTIQRTDHVVKRGESLWTISRHYGTNSRSIAALNGLSVASTLQPGQVLRVRSTHDVARYAVRRGDSLSRIAQKFKISIDQLQTWNRLSRHRTLQPGETLIVSNPRFDKQHEI